MAVIGYLNNLCFDEGASKLGEETGVESSLLREMMTETIQNLFKKANVPYSGPTGSMRYPVGGFFFKTSGKPEGVLTDLGIDESMKVRLEDHKYYDISLGIIVKDFPDDEKLNKVEFVEDNVLDLAKHVAAHYSITREKNKAENTKPYLIIVDENFKYNLINN